MAHEQPYMQTIGEALAVNLEAQTRATMAPVQASTATDSEYRIEAVGDTAALLALKPEWDELLARTGIDHPFLSHDWVTGWWKCYGSGRTLHVLLARDGSRLVGIAPLMRGMKKLYGINLRCLEALYNPHTPRFDFIAAPAEGAAVYRNIWRHLRTEGGWDLLQLSQMPADSRALAGFSQLARGDGCATGIWHGEVSPYIPFTGTFQNYFSQLSSKHRGQVRRRWNRLCERGEVRLEEITEPEQVDAALTEGFRIEALAWKAQTGTAINSAPEVEAFYRAFARHAIGAGLRLMFLTVNGTRIAFAYGICYRNKFSVLKAGYDPEYAYYSPCSLLCYLQLQYGFAHGLEEYEFLGSSDAWKLSWTRHARGHDWLYIFAPNVRARLVYLIKFRWVQLLQRARGYRRLRDILFPKGKARLAGYAGARLSGFN